MYDKVWYVAADTPYIYQSHPLYDTPYISMTLSTYITENSDTSYIKQWHPYVWQWRPLYISDSI